MSRFVTGTFRLMGDVMSFNNKMLNFNEFGMIFFVLDVLEKQVLLLNKQSAISHRLTGFLDFFHRLVF
jgi:hypothetical protein